MGKLAVKKSSIDKYFKYLRHLDNDSKKNLIIKLTESIEIKERTPSDINSMFGAWVDDRTSEEIINEIRNSRVEKKILKNSNGLFT